MARVCCGDILMVIGGPSVIADRDFTAYIGGNYIIGGYMYRAVSCYGNSVLLAAI